MSRSYASTSRRNSKSDYDRYWFKERKQILTAKFYDRQITSLLTWGDEYSEEERLDINRSTKKKNGYNSDAPFTWSYNPYCKSNVNDFYNVYVAEQLIVPDNSFGAIAGRMCISESESREQYPEVWDCIHCWKEDKCKKCGIKRKLK